MIIYRYEKAESYFKDGIKITTKESLIDGDGGMSLYFLKKVGDNYFYRLIVRETDKGIYELKEKKDDKEYVISNFKEVDLKKFLMKKKRTFLFFTNYLKNKN